MEEIESESLVVIVLEACVQHPDLDMATPPPSPWDILASGTFCLMVDYGRAAVEYMMYSSLLIL